jgi:hypothetical protein
MLVSESESPNQRAPLRQRAVYPNLMGFIFILFIFLSNAIRVSYSSLEKTGGNGSPPFSLSKKTDFYHLS